MSEQLDAERVAIAAQTLVIDEATARVVTALSGAGVDTILLKGAGIAHWFYDNGDVRAYDDSDLLVDPAGMAVAEELLATLGFVPVTPPERRAAHAWVWIHPDERVEFDLHRTLQGATKGDRDVWDVLNAETASIPLMSVTVRILNRPASAVHIALHAAHHGVAKSKPSGDLTRAVARLTDDEWHAAAAVAERLGAMPAFAAGLRLLEPGRRIADELRLPTAAPAAVALSVASAPPMALAMEQLANAPGLRAKGALAVRRLAPPARWMRAFYPLARRGTGGLVAAYALRAILLVARAGPELAVWLRTRRASGPR